MRSSRKFRPRRRGFRHFNLEALESRQLLSAADLFGSAIPLVLNAQPQLGSISPAPTYYSFNATEDGRLIAEVAPTGGATRLSLFSSDGELLLQSDGQSPTNPNGLIDIHLAGSPEGTTYYLEVEGLGSSSGSFDLMANYTITTAPFEPLEGQGYEVGVTTEDFNQDGNADLAVTNIFGGISIYLGADDGTFAFQKEYGSTLGLAHVVSGDFNGDGQLDLASTNAFNGTISILKGNGDGTFLQPRLFQMPTTSAADLTAGDFNSDGKLDLAVTDYSSNAIFVLINSESGDFGVAAEYHVGLQPDSIKSGDFNRDGHLDLVTTNLGSNDLCVLLGVGDGTFTSGASVAVGQTPRGLVVSDFNNDGQLDVAVANNGSSDVSVLLGNGDGTFASQMAMAAGNGVRDIVAADFNGDGCMDLATVNFRDGTTSVFLGRGDGTFGPGEKSSQGAPAGTLTAADFNHDGSIDLALIESTAATVQILLGKGDGGFQTQAAQSPRTLTVGAVSADFNGDGCLDLATLNLPTSDVAILLGQNDGTFRFGGRYLVGTEPLGITVGDVNSDGIADLLTLSTADQNIAVLLGRGDGTFAAAVTSPAVRTLSGLTLGGLVAADFNGDGKLDVAIADTFAKRVLVLFGDGTGRFATPTYYAVGNSIFGVTGGDFNHDGHLDLAIVNRFYGITILLNNGAGTFASQLWVNTGFVAAQITSGDFNGDGNLDLASSGVTYSGQSIEAVLLSNGRGAFLPSPLSINTSTHGILVGDFNEDGKSDVASFGDEHVTLSLGRSDGMFQRAGQTLPGLPGVIGDFNGDGSPDLAAMNFDLNSVSVSLGQGEGTFQPALQTAIAGGPAAITRADFNADGQLDVVTANPTAGEVTVSFGSGAGTFQESVTISLGGDPIAVVADDFNLDGRPDVAVANHSTNTVSILLGIGRGTFGAPLTFSVGQHPVALVTGDFNQDGIVDLATSDFGTDEVSILLGRRDGTFREAQPFRVGDGPVALTVSDVNGDGRSDLIAANSLSRDLTLLIGLGSGTFVSTTLPLDAAPSAVATADFNSDGQVDISVVNPTKNTISILFGSGDGAFQTPIAFSAGTVPISLAVGDFNRDGHVDIATANNNSNNVSILLGQGDGTFQSQTLFEVGNYPAALIAGDFNNDGRLDVATANALAEPISVGLGLGNGTFTEPGASSPTIQSNPLIADLNYDGVADVVVLRNDGKLLFRAGLGDGVFQAPIVINTNADDPARDVALVQLDGMALLAAINSRTDSLELFTNVGGQFLETGELAVPGSLPSRILTGDINSDGRADGIITSAASGKLVGYLQQVADDGSSRAAGFELDVGSGISDVVLVDLNLDGLPEIAVTDQVSGDVRVFLNSPTAPFKSQLRFRAGTGLTRVVADADGSAQVQSRAGTSAMVAGLFNDDAIPDLAVLNPGMNRLDLLFGDGHGGLFNPASTTSLLTGQDPSAIVTADFNGDSRADFAVLNQESNDLSIFLNDSQGGFSEQFCTNCDDPMSRVNAGNSPSGLSVGDIDGDGRVDLLLGNDRGDVLTLLGNGDGSFRPYQRIDRHVGLAVSGQDSDEGPGFAIVDQSLDRITYHSNEVGSTFEQGREDGLLAPNAVMFADLNSDGSDDLIVANGGNNEIRVYLASDDDRFGRGLSFFVGTDPTGITVSDLNGDGILDLAVANRGSNDVSLLFGQGQSDHWTLQAGPRLRAGTGPVATVVQDINSDGIADIVVANQQSNDVYLLTGLGRGFFSDQRPIIVATGNGPTQLFVGNFDRRNGLDVVTVNAVSRDLTLISGLGALASGSVRTVSLGEIEPVSAIARDLSRDGLSDLIVADSSGQFTLWLGGTGAVRTINPSGLDRVTNLSDFVLGRVTESSVEVYFTSTGNAAATQATFVLNFNSVTTTEAALNLAPLPVPVTFADSIRVPSAAIFTMIGTETFNRVSFDRAESFAPLPVATFNVESASIDPSVTVAEFSSPSGSQLEVIATLVIGFRDTATEDASQSEAADGEAFAATSYEPASDRDLLITGVAQTPIQRHLQDRPPDEQAAIEILFSSPLELFDVSHAVAADGSKRQTHRELTFLGTNPEGAVQPENRDHPKRPLPTNRNLHRALGVLGSPDVNDDLSLTEPKSAGLTPIHLCALVVCVASVLPLTQESQAGTPRPDRRRKGLPASREKNPS